MRYPQSILQPQARESASEIPEQLQWINSNVSLSLAALRGRVVLLSFWSGSGIHCAHHVIDLKHVQARYSEGITVIGVHTPKFEHERDQRTVTQSVYRRQIRYPVLHDPHFVLWQHYAVSSWPTVIIIDAEGRVAARIAGDGTRDTLVAIIEKLLEEAAVHDLRTFDVADDFRMPEPRTALAFPARIAADERHLYIADTGHHRVLECGHDGRILRVFGNGIPGFLDGEGHEASLCLPHGLALTHDALYVADTGNHAIRRIRLINGQVGTLAGNGQRGHANVRGQWPPRDTPLNSPLDLIVHKEGLYVAMAGSHQIWRFDLGNMGFALYAGSGHLGAGDDTPPNASFAQPSGLAVVGQMLYVSDADGSALRVISLGDAREVQTLVGAGLFVFGDADGHRGDARMQFPQGLCVDPRNLQIYIADSYNGKIRTFHTRNGELRSLPIPNRLDEPGGVACTAGALWIVNSGAHEVLRCDLGTSSTIRIAVGE